MIHAQQRRETTATPIAPGPREAGHPDLAGPETVVPAQPRRRPDAYDLYAEIFALRAESHAG